MNSLLHALMIMLCVIIASTVNAQICFQSSAPRYVYEYKAHVEIEYNFELDIAIAHITEDNLNLLDRRVDFLFTTNGYDDNGTKVDFGDGIHTWEDVTWGEPMSITYPDLEPREIRFFKPIVMGNQPIGAFTITFATAGNGAEYPYRLPDDTWFITAENAYSPSGCEMPSPFTFSNCASEQGSKSFYWHGGTGTGNAYIRYGLGNDGVLKKPIIFVEGVDFSPGGSINPDYEPGDAAYRTQYGAFGWDVFATGIGRSKGSDYSEFANYPAFFQQLHEEGYDLILLDFTDGATFIQKNVEVLKTLLRMVNDHKEAHGVTEPNIVIGASMGGLVARYALAAMEEAGENHCTGTYVSFDSPHKGAHIPMGIQATAWFLAAGNSQSGCPYFEDLWTSLNRPASHQLLFDHFGNALDEGRLSEQPWSALFQGEDEPVSLPQPEGDFSCLRSHFQQELDALGYPKQTRNLGIACGSYTGLFQNNMTAGESILDARILGTKDNGDEWGQIARFNITAAGGPSSLYGTVSTKRLLPGCVASAIGAPRFGNVLFSGALPRAIGCNFLLWSGEAPQRYSSSWVQVTGDIAPLDHAPGAYRNDLGQLLNLIDEIRLCNDVKDDVDFWHPTREEMCFVPTLSALDLDLTLNLANAESAWNEEQLASLTAFDKVWASEGENLKHVKLTEDLGNWLLTELKSFDQTGLTLPHAAGPEYNFGNKLRTIPRTLVKSGGTLYVNDAGFIEFRDPNSGNTNIETHEAWTKSCSADITVEANGSMILGEDKTDAVTRRAIVHISPGTRVHIMAGGTLRLAQGSTLIIEEGAMLILDAGALVDLRTAADHIQVHGELELGGEIDFSGLGYFEFYNTHVLTLSGGLMALTGTAKDHRFIRLIGNTDLHIGSAMLELAEGAVDYGPEARISLAEAGRVRLQSVTLRPDAGITLAPQVIGIYADNPRSIRAMNCDVVGLGTGIHAFIPNGTSPSNPFKSNASFYGFYNCLFRGCGTGLKFQGIRQMELKECIFDAMEPGEEIGGVVSGRYGLHCTDMELVWSHKGMYQHYINAGRTDLPDEDMAAIWIDNILEFRSYGSTIDRNDIGILSPGLSRSNVFLYKGSTVSNNTIGVWVSQGGVDPQGKDYGIVLMDCSNLINNTFGIKGIDILLQVDAPISGGTFPGKVSPNTFMVGATGNRLFDICYLQRYDIYNVFARGNYWDPLPQESHWHLFNMGGMGVPCVNQPSNVVLNYQPLLDEQDLLARYCPADPVFDIDDDQEPSDPTGGGMQPLLDDISCILMDGATSVQAHEAFAQAMQDWYYLDTLSELEGFTLLASIPDAQRDTLNDLCRHYVDMARIFVSRNAMPPIIPMQGAPGYLGLPASSVSLATGELRLVPNPARSEVTILWPGAGGILQVSIYDLYGRRMRYIEPIPGQAIYVGDIPAGTWILDILDPDTGDRQTERMTILR